MSKEVLAAANKVLPQWGLTSKLQRFCYYKISVLNSSDGFQNPPLRQYPARCASYNQNQQMAIPKNKEELIFEIKNNYSKLKKDLETIPTELTKEKELDGHAKETKMSISDLVAYLIGWGELVLKWNNKKENGEKVDFPETGYKWNELGKLAQKFYSDYENLDNSDLLNKLDQTVDKILKLIESNTNKELYENAWYDKWTKGKMIQFNTSSPYKNARSRVRKWKKTLKTIN